MRETNISPDAEQFTDPIDLEITDSFDLHAFRPSEARAALLAYLDEARARRFRFVRIVHGKGIGVQREMVRKVLSESDFINGFKSGDEFSGGWGATVAELKVST